MTGDNEVSLQSSVESLTQSRQVDDVFSRKERKERKEHDGAKY